ncbi:MAG: tetratricopeptide repeat protein [Gemmatimonadales bacterium]
MRRAFLLGLLALGGCAYYNGMYNANRLAHQAEKAEKEGRTFDAASLWGQVGVKADTVLARHGKSQWADDAKLLRGKAYQRLGDCQSATSYLNQVVAASTDPRLVEEASFLLGRCYQELGETEEATAAFSRLVNSTDPARRNESLYQHGRSLRIGGRYQEALAELQHTTDPRARGERLAALAALGRFAEGHEIVDTLIAAGDTTTAWDDILDLLGRHDTLAASTLTDRLVGMKNSTAEQRARWLIADGKRLAASRPEEAFARFRKAIVVGSGSQAPGKARFAILQQRLAQATVDSLDALMPEISELATLGGEVSFLAAGMDRAARRIRQALDTVAAGAGQPDLRIFLAAEEARDSLGADRIAVVLFGMVPGRWPDSPYAAKSLMALAATDPTQADSVREVLNSQYGDSPYLLAVMGDSAPGYRALEDSLRAFAYRVLAASRVGAPAGRPGVRTPTSSRVPEN